jgi:hypothetical protein
MRASASLASSLGVVPEDTSECQPDTAPQAMVMNRKGNSVPGNTGPLPSTNFVSAGMQLRHATSTAAASRNTVPSLRKVDR